MREQRAEPACDAAIRYFLLGSPSVLPGDFISSHNRLPLSEIRSIADKGRLNRDDDGTLPFERKSPHAPAAGPGTPSGRAARVNDEPTRIYVPLLLRPWIMQACHAHASCHLGVACTHSMLKRSFLWISTNISTRWWLRHCLQCQARKSRQTSRWAILSLPLPPGPGIAISVDCFGPLPASPKGNSYILLFTDHFTGRADMHAVSAAEFTAEGTQDILINKYIPL